MNQHDSGCACRWPDGDIPNLDDPATRRLAVEHAAAVETRLLAHEKGWRLRPGDGLSPSQGSACALARMRAVEAEVDRRVGEIDEPDTPAGGPDKPTPREVLRQQVRYFPVLFVSAPHIEDGVSGAFPGMPTPLLYATVILDRLLLIDEFCAPRTPWITAVMNPATWNEEFERELTDHLREHRPVVVGVSNLSESHHYAMRVAQIVRRELPETLVVLGGQHEDGVNVAAYESASARVEKMTGRRREASAVFALSDDELHRLRPLETLASPEGRRVVDVVFSGDAPYAVVELLRTVAENLGQGTLRIKEALLERRSVFAALPGSGALQVFDDVQGRLRSLPLSGEVIDGDRLPFIDVSRLTHENRFPVFGWRLTAQILACLGCKYACSFCHESADSFLYGVNRFRQRSAAHVVHEIELRVEQGYDAVFFDDSTFTQNPRWLAELLTLLEQRSGARVEWGCQTTINDVDEATLLRMAGAGCSYVYFGVESAAPTPLMVQKVLQLSVTSSGTSWASRFRQVAQWCKRAGIRVGTSLQFGLGEAEEDRLETLQLVAEMHREGCIPDGCVALNINSPYPGTQQWIGMLKRGDLLPDYRVRLQRHSAFETAHQFSSIRGPEVEKLYALAVEVLGNAVHDERAVT